VHGDTLVAASVPSQTNVTYAWSVIGSGGTINGLANKNTVAFDVGATGTEVALQAVVTNTTTSCAATSVVHVPIPCQVPLLVSADGQPPTPHYIPSNEDTGHFDLTGSNNIWAAYVADKTTAALYNGLFNHFSGTAWAQPTGPQQTVNDSAARVLYYKVATDTAGDRSVRLDPDYGQQQLLRDGGLVQASNSTWSTPQTVGTVFNQDTPVDVKVDRTSGVALIAWAGGAFGAVIPHLRN